MSYLFFKHSGTLNFSQTLPENYTIEKKSLSFNSLNNIFWRLISFMYRANIVVYQIVNHEKGGVISYAYVIGPNFKFPFMKSKLDIHIGPCLTIKEERGQGLYPILLTYIVKQHPDGDKYMIVHNQNVSSMRGIAKAGFVLFAEGHRTKFTKKYAIDKFV